MARIFDAFKQFFDSNGDPLASGTLEFFEDGVLSNKQDTFSDASLNNANPNPVTLDGAGRLPFDVFGDGSYSVELRSKPSSSSIKGVQIGLLNTVGGATGSRLAFSDWTSTIIYNIPAFVVGSNGLYYRSLSVNNLGNDPTLNPGANEFWEDIRFLGVYNETVSYLIGDVIKTTAGNLWKSLVNSNLNNDPMFDSGANWLPAVALKTSDQPTNVSPADGAADVSATPTLTGSAYSGTDTHVQSIWTVYSDAGGTTVVWSVIDNANSLTATVPTGILDSETQYWWGVQYIGVQSESLESALTSFTAEVAYSSLVATTLYTGNGTVQDVINDLDFVNKIGRVWLKNRVSTINDHFILDTLRGAGNYISSNTTAAESFFAPLLTSFNTEGFSVGTGISNTGGDTYVAWQNLVAEGLFDIVEYDGTGVPQDIPHNLNAEVGHLEVKRLDVSEQWGNWCNGLASNEALSLNTTLAKFTAPTWFDSTSPTSSNFRVGTEAVTNSNGGRYIAYLYAHNPAKGIFCDSYVGTGAAGNKIVTGFPVGRVRIKRTDIAADWVILDNLRTPTSTLTLQPNNTTADSNNQYILPAGSWDTDGFTLGGGGTAVNASGGTYIFIAEADPDLF